MATHLLQRRHSSRLSFIQLLPYLDVKLFDLGSSLLDGGIDIILCLAGILADISFDPADDAIKKEPVLLANHHLCEFQTVLLPYLLVPIAAARPHLLYA